MAASGHGFDRGKVLEYMNAIAPPPDGQKSHSVSALNRFLKRRSDDINRKKTSGIDPARADQATEDVRATFFSKVDEFARELHELGLVKYDVENRLAPQSARNDSMRKCQLASSGIQNGTGPACFAGQCAKGRRDFAWDFREK